MDDSVEKLIVAGTSYLAGSSSDVEDENEELEMYSQYCESYDLEDGWKTCALPSHEIDNFYTSIVWKNQLVALGLRSVRFDNFWRGHHLGEYLYVYNHSMEGKPGEPWSTKDAPPQYSSQRSVSLFLNLKDHLCLDGESFSNGIVTNKVWCLADLESETEWIQMPETYVFQTVQNKLIGTLPAKIISELMEIQTSEMVTQTLEMAAAPSLSWYSYFLPFVYVFVVFFALILKFLEFRNGGIF